MPRPVIVLRSVPVGYRVERFSADEATIAVWYVGIVGSGATVQSAAIVANAGRLPRLGTRSMEGQLVRELSGTDARPLQRRRSSSPR